MYKLRMLLNLVIGLLSVSLLYCQARAEPFTRGLWAIWCEGYPGFLSDSEKQKMLDINTNYLEACIQDPNAYMAFCNSTNGKVTMFIEGSPNATNPCSPSDKRLWIYIRCASAPDTGVITNFIQNMYTDYASNIGFRSYLIDHETSSNLPSKNYALQHACAKIDAIDPNPNHKSTVINEVGTVLIFNPNFFNEVTSLDIFENEYYPFYTDTPYEGSVFQQALDGLINSYQTCKNVTDSRPLVWQAVMQVYQNAEPPVGPRRFPTREEINCQAYLAISRGAKGVLAFTYQSTQGGEELRGLLAYDRSIAHYNSRPGTTDPYYDVRDLFDTLEFLGPLIIRLKSDLAFNSEQLPAQSYIKDITGEQIINGKGTIEVGTFIDTSYSRNVEAFILVNRLCLPAQSQSISITLQKQPNTRYLVKDVRSGEETVYLTDVNGYVTVTKTIGPGDGRLLLFKKANSGMLASNTTWYETEYVSGDVTVNSGITLTITSGSTIKVLPNLDDQSAGVDPVKSELILNGVLKADGQSNSNINIKSSSVNPQPGQWYGIRVLTGGSAKLNYANIKHGYAGITYQNAASDTIRNSKIESCQMYGVKCENSNLVIRDNFINNIGTSTGGYGIACLNSTPKIVNDSLIDCYYGIDLNNYQAASTNIDTVKIIRTTIGERGYNLSNNTNTNIRWNTIQGYFAAGIFSDKSTFKLNYSTIDGTIWGVAVTNASNAKVYYSNLLNYSVFGVYLAGKFTIADLGNDQLGGGNNNIFPTGGWKRAVYNTILGSPTVKAEDNWWGVAPPPSTFFYGLVDYNPYLSEPYGAGSITPLTGTASQPSKQFSAIQNFPNPFNPSTTIKFSLEQQSKVTLEIYNVTGQKIRTLVDELRASGEYSVKWEGLNSAGDPVSSGVYFYRLKTNENTIVRKMTLLR